ncbi:unnamed protein product [Chrysoparadoxa australica]
MSHLRKGVVRRRSQGPDDLYTSRAQDATQKKPWCVRIKVISMGSLASGKSCLIKRYCEERFVSKWITTLGVDYGVRPVQVLGKQVRVNFWDMGGHPDFFEVRNEFYADSQGGILVYAQDDRASFDELQDWVNEAAQFGAGGIPLIVCANKSDKERAVSREEGLRWAQLRGYPYYETSAMSGANVGQVFNHLFEQVLQHTQKKKGGGASSLSNSPMY